MMKDQKSHKKFIHDVLINSFVSKSTTLLLSFCLILTGMELRSFAEALTLKHSAKVCEHNVHVDELSPASVFKNQGLELSSYQRIKNVFKKAIKYSIVAAGVIVVGLSIPVAKFFVDIAYDSNDESRVVQSLLPAALLENEIESDGAIDPFLNLVFQQNEALFKEHMPELTTTALASVKREKVLGLYFHLLETGKVNAEFFSTNQLSPLTVMKANVYKSYFDQKAPYAKVPVNDVLLTELEKVSGGIHYEVFMKWEGNLYSHRLMTEDKFTSHLREETGLSKNEFVAAFDQYFFPVLNHKLKEKSITLDESEVQNIRDFALIMAVYHFVHRFAEDEIDAYTNIPGRTTVGFHARSASLGAFQGYENIMADVFSENPEVRKLLQQDKNEIVRTIADRWDNSSSMEIQDNIKSTDFLFGVNSPVNDYWQYSLLGLFPYKIDNYLEVRQKLEKIGVNNPALNSVIALESDKNRIRPVREYFNQSFYTDLSQLQPGEIIRLSPEFMHFVFVTGHKLKDWGGYLQNKSESDFFKWVFTYEDIFGQTLNIAPQPTSLEYPFLQQKSA